MSGLFITLEGPDGSGKSTISRMLVSYLRQNDFNVTLTREPGGTDISEDIRRIILDTNNTEMKATTEALLYAASRAQHVGEKIIPAIKADRVVVCDRFVLSSLVYQGKARGLGVENIRKLNEFATIGLEPDLILFFDMDPELALKRKTKKSKGDRLEREKIDFHKDVYKGYKSLLGMYGDKVAIIDAKNSKRNVFEQVKKAVDKLTKGE